MKRLFLLTVCVLSAATPSRAEAPFHMTDLPGLTWWASAQDSPRFQNADGTGAVGPNDPVGYLGDLSGANHHALMGAGLASGGDAFRPRFAANINQGRPGILFDGANDFLDLGSPLFSGAESFTLALALGGANVNPAGRSVFGAWGSNDAVGLEYASGGALVATARATGGLVSNVNSRGSNFDSLAGPEATQIILMRYTAGGTFDLFSNGQLISSVPAASGALLSQANKILGNENLSNGGGPAVAQPSIASKFYFLEGMATRSALSDEQIQNVYQNWTQKIPGVQRQLPSPNVYWDAAHNPDRTLPVAHNAGHIQGVASGGGSHYVFYSSMIEKYDASWHAVSHNDTILDGVGTAAKPALHTGDGDYYNGKLYAPMETDLGNNGKYIGVFDATQSNLPLVKSVDISAQGHEVSAMTIVPEHGAGGVMYMTSFVDRFGGDKLWMYNLAGGDVNNPSFGDFLGALDLPPELVTIQGVAWRAPYFYFVSGRAIDRVKYENGSLAAHAELYTYVAPTMQGIGFDGSTLMQAIQGGSNYEYIQPLVAVDFTPVAVPEPSTAGLAFMALAALAAVVAHRGK